MRFVVLMIRTQKHLQIKNCSTQKVSYDLKTNTCRPRLCRREGAGEWGCAKAGGSGGGDGEGKRDSGSERGRGRGEREGETDMWGPWVGSWDRG